MKPVFAKIGGLRVCPGCSRFIYLHKGKIHEHLIIYGAVSSCVDLCRSSSMKRMISSFHVRRSE